MTHRLRYDAIPPEELDQFLQWCGHIAQHDKGAYARPLAHSARAVVADMHARMKDFCDKPYLHTAHSPEERLAVETAHTLAARLESYLSL